MAIYIGLAISDSMFEGEVTVTRKPLTPEETRELVARGAVPCVNPSHASTLAALSARFGISVEAPERAPLIRLKSGDVVVIAAVRGLPRLEGRHEYSQCEIERAQFSFASWTVH